MKTIPLIAAAAAIAVASSAAFAQAQQNQPPIDLSTVTCKDFAASDKQTIALIMMWLQGYYSDEDAKPVVDFEQMKKSGDKLGDYCGKNPAQTLITAADEVLGNE